MGVSVAVAVGVGVRVGVGDGVAVGVGLGVGVEVSVGVALGVGVGVFVAGGAIVGVTSVSERAGAAVSTHRPAMVTRARIATRTRISDRRLSLRGRRFFFVVLSPSSRCERRHYTTKTPVLPKKWAYGREEAQGFAKPTTPVLPKVTAGLAG